MIEFSVLLIEAIKAIVKTVSGIVITLKQDVLLGLLSNADNKSVLILGASFKDA